MQTAGGPSAFPIARWLAAAWFAVWFPTYWVVWGWQNFLWFCDIALILTCVGLWRGGSLLLSSQAVGGVLPNALWVVDVSGRLLFGKHVFGGTEYMWMSEYPLWVRLLSIFHLALPVVLLWSLRRVGYDRRGWLLQTAIAGSVMVVCRLLAPEKNMNYIYTDPLFGVAWGPPPLHLAVILAGLVVLILLPTHFVLTLLYPDLRRPRPGT